MKIDAIEKGMEVAVETRGGRAIYRAKVLGIVTKPETRRSGYYGNSTVKVRYVQVEALEPIPAAWWGEPAAPAGTVQDVKPARVLGPWADHAEKEERRRRTVAEREETVEALKAAAKALGFEDVDDGDGGAHVWVSRPVALALSAAVTLDDDPTLQIPRIRREEGGVAGPLGSPTP